MTHRSWKIYTRLVPLFSAGILLQMGGCSIDIPSVATGVFTSIASSVLSTFVFSAFNLAP
ncbi:MAG: hypothetical protein AABZ47_10495 [Planctomycetota bacterium]